MSTKNAEGPKKPRRKRTKKAKPDDTQDTLLVVPRKPPRHKDSATRKRFLLEYERTFGNVSASCTFANIARKTFYRWMGSKTPLNVRFQKRIAAIRPVEALLDLAEGTVVHAMVEKKDANVALQILRTKGRSRGYGDNISLAAEQQELETKLTQIKAVIERQARLSGVSFKEELALYLELLGSEIKPEIRSRLASELE